MKESNFEHDLHAVTESRRILKEHSLLSEITPEKLKDMERAEATIQEIESSPDYMENARRDAIRQDLERFPMRVEKTVRVAQREYGTAVGKELSQMNLIDGETAIVALPPRCQIFRTAKVRYFVLAMLN